MADSSVQAHGGDAAAQTDKIVIDMLTGAWVTQLAAAIARLGVPDLLAARQPQTCEQLAKAAKADPLALGRSMRALASLGVFRDTGAGYALTSVGDRLRSDTEASMRDFFLAETDEVHRRSWDHLVDAIRWGDRSRRPSSACRYSSITLLTPQRVSSSARRCGARRPCRSEAFSTHATSAMQN